MAFTRDFNSAYDFDKNEFSQSKDVTRPIFYMDKKAKVIKKRHPECTSTDKKSQRYITETVLEEIEMVRVSSPNETLNVFGGRVTEEHKRRWPQHYEAFRKGESYDNGTPFSKWPEVANNADLLSQFRYFRCMNVEDVANMSDGALQNFHDAMTWRLKARSLLNEQTKAKQAERDHALAATASVQSEQMATMAQQIAELKAALEAKGAPDTAKRKPGRPARPAKPLQAKTGQAEAAA